MTVNWEDVKARDDEEWQRLRLKKCKVAAILQDAIEGLMDDFLSPLGGDLGATASSLAQIETVWRVLGLEYVTASERWRRDREEANARVAEQMRLYLEANPPKENA